MSPETEIKLDLSQEALDALVGSDLLGEPDKVLDQRSTYFDTADRRLWKEGYTLRIRQVGETRTQTVKATGPSLSLFARSEWETPIEGDEPVLDHTSPLLGEFGGDVKLEPVFDVVIARRLWNVVENGSRIEVVLDEGDAISGDRRSAIREVEIELKEGRPSDLFVFARKIDAVARFRFSVRSKAERGFVLAGAQKTVVKAEPVYLERSMNAVAAFRAIALACVRQFRLNEDILLQRRNPEALHQTRVAIRRLRSALSLFKSVLPGDEPERLSQELRWLAAVLGEARNIDVLLAKASDIDLVSKLKTARAATYHDAIDALGSSRVHALMLDMINWLECGDYLPGNGPVSPDVPSVQDFAARALEKQRKRLKRDGSALAKADDEHRHDVRKDAKKLRYAAEFFASLFDDKRGVRRRKKFLAAIEALQEELGALNDLVTSPEVLKKHGLADHPASGSVVSDRDKAGLLGKAQSAVDEMLDIKRFWR